MSSALACRLRSASRAAQRGSWRSPALPPKAPPSLGPGPRRARAAGPPPGKGRSGRRRRRGKARKTPGPGPPPWPAAGGPLGRPEAQDFPPALELVPGPPHGHEHGLVHLLLPGPAHPLQVAGHPAGPPEGLDLGDLPGGPRFPSPESLGQEGRDLPGRPGAEVPRDLSQLAVPEEDGARVAAEGRGDGHGLQVDHVPAEDHSPLVSWKAGARRVPPLATTLPWKAYPWGTGR